MPANPASGPSDISHENNDVLLKRKMKVAAVRTSFAAVKLQARWRGYALRKRKIVHVANKSIYKWPEPLIADFASPELMPPLSSNLTKNLEWIGQHKQILIRTLTWNLCALPPPPTDFLTTILPLNKFHIYVIGSEECERSIAQSAINPSKKNWETDVSLALGANYVPLRSHTLQAIHIIAFVHTSIVTFISEVTSAAIAMGIGNTLGNKGKHTFITYLITSHTIIGAVALSFRVGKTRFTFVNAHLEAHQKAVKERNTQVNRIHADMAGQLKRGVVSKINTTLTASDPLVGGEEKPPPIEEQPLDEYADRLVFMGDFNYRINGNRTGKYGFECQLLPTALTLVYLLPLTLCVAVVDYLLGQNMHSVLLSNDQLTLAQSKGIIFAGYTEPPLYFRPTYKLDVDADTYDSSSKQRIPAWTDRILYRTPGMNCVEYNADFSIKTSDHRPVYASFVATLEFSDRFLVVDDKKTIEYNAPSQVCVVM